MDNTQIFKCHLYFLHSNRVLSVVYCMMGEACNSWIPQANLHAVLNMHAKNCNHYIVLFMFESFVS
jgi:hypothetical protein